MISTALERAELEAAAARPARPTITAAGGHGPATTAQAQQALDKDRPRPPARDGGPGECSWLGVGMAIHSEWPDETGWQLWDEWSGRDRDRYDPTANRKQWDSFHESGNRQGRLGIGSLFHWAGVRFGPERAPDDDLDRIAPPEDDGPPPEITDEPTAKKTPKTKKGSKPKGKRYALPRPKGKIRFGNLENDYWTWAGSLRRCLLHLGYHVRHNIRAEQIEYLPITGKRLTPKQIEKAARSNERRSSPCRTVGKS